MERTIKLIVAVLIIAAFISYCIMWYKTFYLGNYYINATFFMAVLYGMSPLIIGYFLYNLIKFMFNNKFS